MKNMSIKYFFLLAALLLALPDVSQAQRNRRSRYGSQTPPPPPPSGSAYGNNATADTTGGSGYGSTTNASNNGYAGIDTTLPITVIQSTGGLIDSAKLSLRNDGAIERNLVKDRTPLAYEYLREDDAVFVVRVWRVIDAREKLNQSFRYAASEDNGNQRFISILLKAIKDGEVTAFEAQDDRFTTPITPEKAESVFGGGLDTSKKYDLDGNIIGYEVRPKAVDPDSIYKFQIKEEWIFDKESSRLFVRIIGIAPIYAFKTSQGVVLDPDRVVWWVYYPDMRPIFAKYDVYNPKNSGAKMTWEELFESRMFSSYIVKSNLDNPFDLPLSAVYPNNTLFRLLEGEKIKEKIFNYEQALWSY
jgi:gliding motility associated protien GldN